MNILFAAETSPVLALLTPANIIAITGLLLGALGGLAFMSAKRKKIIALAAYYAFHIVEDIGKEREGDDAFDKAATFLSELNRWLVVNGWRPLKEGEKELAQMNASALHGAEIAKAKVAEAAAHAVPK